MKPQYQVVFKKSAAKELEKLPKRVQNKILDAIQLLAVNPFTELLQIKKMKGAEDLFRIRIQDYRVIYQVEAERVTIAIIKVGHRKDVYQ
jgi:mRNA interferase RelE/StbE